MSSSFFDCFNSFLDNILPIFTEFLFDFLEWLAEFWENWILLWADRFHILSENLREYTTNGCLCVTSWRISVIPCFVNISLLITSILNVKTVIRSIRNLPLHSKWLCRNFWFLHNNFIFSDDFGFILFVEFFFLLIILSIFILEASHQLLHLLVLLGQDFILSTHVSFFAIFLLF